VRICVKRSFALASGRPTSKRFSTSRGIALKNRCA
jgi:hypothetical protein